MKPERIQFVELIRSLVWGIFQTLQFDTPEQAENFSNFILDMAVNHGRSATYQLDASHTRVILLVEANSDGQIIDNRKFVAKVLDIYADWNSPDEDTPKAAEGPTSSVN